VKNNQPKINSTAIVHRIDLGHLRAVLCHLQTLPVFGGGVYKLEGVMHSNPEFTRAYRKDMTPEQRTAEDRIKELTKKVLFERMDTEAAVRRERRKERILLAIFFIILIIGAWISLANADTINMDAIAQIESSDNAKAYNTQDGAIGKYQITKIVLTEYNNFHAQKFSRKDLYNEHINFEIASWFMRVRIPQMLVYYRLPLTTENKIICWNAGIRNAIKGRVPTITKQYLKKYARLTGGAR
jgi:hypothetical protein